MKLHSLALILALLPAALFAGGNTPTGPSVIPAGTFASAYVINTPGSYVLAGNRTTTGSVNVIEITAPDVTLDLNGFAVDQANGSAGGIYIPAPENVEIHNGSVLHAAYGIRAGAGKGVRIVNVRVVGAINTGISVQAAGAQIDRCRTDDCSHYGIFTGVGLLITECIVSGGNDAWGISSGAGSRVVHCVVQGGKYGIALTNGTAENCIVSNCQNAGFWMWDSTLRNVESVNNSQVGVVINGTLNYIGGSRVTGNPMAVNGSFVSGGGNFIQ